jgi:hypothetical protein
VLQRADEEWEASQYQACDFDPRHGRGGASDASGKNPAFDGRESSGHGAEQCYRDA